MSAAAPKSVITIPKKPRPAAPAPAAPGAGAGAAGGSGAGAAYVRAPTAAEIAAAVAAARAAEEAAERARLVGALPFLGDAGRRGAVAAHEAEEKENTESAEYHDAQICTSTFDGLATTLESLRNRDGVAAALAQLDRCIRFRAAGVARAKKPGEVTMADVKHEEVVALLRNLRTILADDRLKNTRFVSIRYKSIEGWHGFSIIVGGREVGYVTRRNVHFLGGGCRHGRKTRRLAKRRLAKRRTATRSN